VGVGEERRKGTERGSGGDNRGEIERKRKARKRGGKGGGAWGGERKEGGDGWGKTGRREGGGKEDGGECVKGIVERIGQYRGCGEREREQRW